MGKLKGFPFFYFSKDNLKTKKTKKDKISHNILHEMQKYIDNLKVQKSR